MPPNDSAGHPSPREPDPRYSALISNAAAIRAVASAVESTLGPKGLNCMLVDRGGDVTVTNDGSTILSRIDASHPAARILVRAARSQDEEVGDGTTTTAVLAAALISEGQSHVLRGVPVSMLIEGLRRGIAAAVEFVESRAIRCESMEDAALESAVRVAARGEEQIARAVLKAAAVLGVERLIEPGFDLRQSLVLAPGGRTESFAGIVLARDRLNRQMPEALSNVTCLVISDALEPEAVEAEALTTERGFSAYVQNLERFKASVAALAATGVGLVAVQKGVHDLAEQALTEAGSIVLRRVGASDIARLAGHTGARVLKRQALLDGPVPVDAFGRAVSVETDSRRGHVLIKGGAGEPAATVLVGAGTREVAEETRRMAEDACGALQSALRTGLAPGGGSVELAAARSLDAIRAQVSGMAAYGLDCVREALRKPIAQIAANAGYNPLEKVEQASAAQERAHSCSIGIDCDSGEAADMLALGVLDPVGVRTRALATAGEVAEAVLRINTIVRMKDAPGEEGASNVDGGV